ncbi:MAG TPA: DUF554 domain-containing protein [Halanaerobiales bacterium]|nr:DUF554 domain-containing protein [Halanaerobiales bacterium]
MIGTIVNTAAIIAGGFLGNFLKGKFSSRIQETVMQGISLAVMLIGLKMAFSLDKNNGTILIIFSLVIGGIIGEVINIEKKLNNVGDWLREKVGDDEFFVQGFVQTSLIYCVGAMAIMGAIQDGLNSDPSLLYTKSLLDGTSSIAFAATYGIGVVFSAIPVFIYQGSITLLASYAQQILNDSMIMGMTATGGLLIFAIGLNIIKVAKIKVGNLLPSLLVAIILFGIF